MDLDANPKRYTVTFTVKLTGASIGAGFRAIRQNVTFRGLSRSIGPDNGCQLQRPASVTIPEGPQKRVTSNALSHCLKRLFCTFFYRHGSAQAVRSTVPIEKWRCSDTVKDRQTSPTACAYRIGDAGRRTAAVDVRQGCQAAGTQLSSCKPGTFENSRVLLVISTACWLSA